MSVLKNLTKIIGLCFLIAGNISDSSAQILNMSLHFDKLNLSEEFLSNLELCRFFSYEDFKESQNVEVKTTYSVVGMKDNLCRLMVEGETNTQIKIVQTCALPLDKAKEYATALRNFQAKKYSPLKDKDIYLQDEDYLKAVAIMEDRNFCHVMRYDIDNTKQIRDNWVQCQPAQQSEVYINLEIIREILGNNNQGCGYMYSLQKKTDVSNKPQYKFDFKCNFSDEQKEKYLQILQSNVMPMEEGLDFSSVMRISLKEEMEFIINNCEYLIEK